MGERPHATCPNESTVAVTLDECPCSAPASASKHSQHAPSQEPEGHHYTLTHTTIFTEPGRKPSKAWGVRTWKGVPDKEPSELKQGGKREWLVLE